jgi:hypothetical protein
MGTGSGQASEIVEIAKVERCLSPFFNKRSDASFVDSFFAALATFQAVSDNDGVMIRPEAIMPLGPPCSSTGKSCD